MLKADAHEVSKYLNTLLKLDPHAVSKVLTFRVGVNDDLYLDKELKTLVTLDKQLSALGILNGLFDDHVIVGIIKDDDTIREFIVLEVYKEK